MNSPGLGIEVRVPGQPQEAAPSCIFFTPFLQTSFMVCPFLDKPWWCHLSVPSAPQARLSPRWASIPVCYQKITG